MIAASSLISAAAIKADTITIIDSFPTSGEIVAATDNMSLTGDDGNISLAQSFSVDSAFSAKTIYLIYENDSNGYQDWDMTVTIFEVADVSALTLIPGTPVYTNTFTFPAPLGGSGTDTIAKLELTTPVALNASVGTAGYAIQFSEASGNGSNPGFEWLRTGSSFANAYPGGVAYDDSNAKNDGERDFTLVISSLADQPVVWQGFDVVDGWADTGVDNLGWVYVESDPWIYLLDLQTWFHAPAGFALPQSGGGWVYLLGGDNMGSIVTQFDPWFYSQILQRWIYAPSGFPSSSGTANWVFLR